MPPEKGAETEGTLPFARLWMAQSAGSMESRTAKQLRPIAQGCVATLGNGSDPNVDNPKGVGFIEIEIESHVLSISIAIPISIWIIPIFGSRFPGSRSYPGKVFGPIMAEPLQGSVGVLRIPDSRGSCATPGYRTLPLRGMHVIEPAVSHWAGSCLARSDGFCVHEVATRLLQQPQRHVSLLASRSLGTKGCRTAPCPLISLSPYCGGATVRAWARTSGGATVNVMSPS